MDTIYTGDEPIVSMFVGEMGVKSVLVGDTNIYTRAGGYFYLELEGTA
jgi:hypothetical protein